MAALTSVTTIPVLPDLDEGAGTNGRGHVRVPGGAGEGYYRIVVVDGKVIELSLDVRQDCYE